MELPSRILVGYRYVSVCLKDLGVDGDDGFYSPEESRITLNTKQNEFEQPNTFVHELLHAIWDKYDLGEDEAEEKIVEITANGLIQIFLTNPEVLSYLQGALNNQRGR